jgi:2-oxoglutarate dehydrogenase E2 component (dihydrolipoamide succinyltransferase)
MSKYEFKMPRLGESITEAAIITWFKNVGDTIEQDEMLLEVATDKVDSEVPSTVSGVIEEILFKANEVIKIGDTIAIIKTGTKGLTSKEKSNVISSAVEKSQKKTLDAPKKIIKPSLREYSGTNNSLPNRETLERQRELFFSPLIIAIAKEQHISFEELARIPATGNDGRLRKSDVFQYIKEGRPYKFVQPSITQDPTAYRIPQLNLDKGKGKIVKMDRMRQMIADRMVYSKHTSPHVTAYVEADLT